MNRYKNIFDIINEIKPQTIMEIGTWNGVNAVKMIKTAQRWRDSVCYYGFDLFEDFTEAKKEFCPKIPAKYEDVVNRFSDIHCRVELIKGNTHKTLAKFVATPIDLIFMDGGHSLETIQSDWNNIQKFISVKTTILLDDYYINRNDVGCQNLVKDLIASTKWAVEPLEPIDECNDGTQMVRVNLNH